MRLKSKTLAPLLAAQILLSGACTAAGVSEITLENGMRVFVKPDHRAPIAVAQVWYGVGSSSEPAGLTGISHVLEHMMFKGTPANPAGEYSRIIASLGGEENAFTSRDYTAYYAVLGADKLDTALMLEADRMRNLSLPEEAFQRERNVVKEERLQRTDDEPTALLMERLNAAAYLNGPYGQPVIGWMEDLSQLTVADLKDWYQRFYQPANAALVVVGDVEPDRIFQIAEREFGALESVPRTLVKPRREPAQRGERRIEIEAPAKVPFLAMAYHVPTVLTADVEWEPYALDVLTSILDGGRSSRFSTRLVRDQAVVSGIDTGYDLIARYDDLLSFTASPANGKSLVQVEAAIEAELELLKTTLVSADELKRVKAGVIAAKVYSQDSVQAQAGEIGALEMLGLGWQWLDQYPQRIDQVTPEQIQAVAKKYFTRQTRTVAILKPQSVDAAAREE